MVAKLRDGAFVIQSKPYFVRSVYPSISVAYLWGMYCIGREEAHETQNIFACGGESSRLRLQKAWV